MMIEQRSRPTETAYAELQGAYDFYNEHLFEGALPPCLLTFQREKRTMGYYSFRRFRNVKTSEYTDEIALNPEYFPLYPMLEVLQTLVHEMGHQWQAHFGTPSRKCYHDREWADKMESVGLMPSDTGQPGGKRTGQKMADYVIQGGRLEMVTSALLGSGFAISWLDRFPIAPPRPPAGSMFVLSPPSGRDLDEDDEGSCDDDLNAHAQLFVTASTTSLAQLHPGLDFVERPTGLNRSNREKYTCPSCQISLWGRPNLRVKCADCELLLVAGLAAATASVADAEQADEELA